MMNLTPSTMAFQTPPRILIPKLLRSRDAWKRKAWERKKQRKSLEIRVRDLTASRLRQKHRNAMLQEQLQTAHLQLEHAQQQLRQAQQQRDALQAKCDARVIPFPAPMLSTTLDPATVQKKTNF